MIRLSAVKRLRAEIHKSSQSAHQADGSSSLSYRRDAINIRPRQPRIRVWWLNRIHLDVNILTGTPFMVSNDVAVRPAKRYVILGDETTLYVWINKQIGRPSCHTSRTRAACPATSTTMWPGGFLEIELPSDIPSDSEYALESRIDAPNMCMSSSSAQYHFKCLRENPHYQLVEWTTHFQTQRAVQSDSPRPCTNWQ